jgi:hypothetical protein
LFGVVEGVDAEHGGIIIEIRNFGQRAFDFFSFERIAQFPASRNFVLFVIEVVAGIFDFG